jgi:hypothetical protein
VFHVLPVPSSLRFIEHQHVLFGNLNRSGNVAGSKP